MIFKEGDRVVSPKGLKWEVIATGQEVVTAREEETGVVSRFLPEDLTRINKDKKEKS